MFKSRFWISFFFITAALSFLILIVSVVTFFFSPAVHQKEGIKYTVKLGASIQSVADDLFRQHIIKNRLLFYFLIWYRGDGKELKAGQYLFKMGMTSPQLLEQIVTGTGIIYHIFTIIPGWSFSDLRRHLLTASNMTHLLKNMTDTDFMNRLGHPELSPEGRFFAETYYYTENASDISILKRAWIMMENKLNTAWEQREVNLPFVTSTDALIAASLVEKEAYLKSERPIIAAVIINRLRNNMLLQIDPTVIYGLGLQYDGRITKQDLVTDTPYNTYLHKGLPPTPIAIPSYDSILSVLHPAKNDYLYFVARGDGSHQFSKTLIEHHIAVNALKKANSAGFFNTDRLRYYLIKNQY